MVTYLPLLAGIFDPIAKLVYSSILTSPSGVNMEVITLVEISHLHVPSICRRGHFSLIRELFGQIFDFVKKEQGDHHGMPMFLLHEESKEGAQEADKSGTADGEVAVPPAGKVWAGGDILSYILSGRKMAEKFTMGPMKPVN